MTFAQLQTEVMERTRQTSTEAGTRVMRELRDRHNRVTSSVGLGSARRHDVTTSVTIGSDAVTFVDLEKVTAVWMESPERRVLDEVSFDTWRHLRVHAATQGLPSVYAIDTLTDLDGGSGGVKIRLHPVPGSGFNLSADGLQRPSVVPTTPWIPESFHDVLMHGALADEWMQLKQDDLAAKSEAVYEQRLAELRYFIAKSAYLDIHQGARGSHFNRGDYLPGYFVPRWW